MKKLEKTWKKHEKQTFYFRLRLTISEGPAPPVQLNVYCPDGVFLHSHDDQNFTFFNRYYYFPSRIPPFL